MLPHLWKRPDDKTQIAEMAVINVLEASCLNAGQAPTIVRSAASLSRVLMPPRQVCAKNITPGAIPAVLDAHLPIACLLEWIDVVNRHGEIRRLEHPRCWNCRNTVLAILQVHLANELLMEILPSASGAGIAHRQK